mmetsp:Transcript_64894/g.146384  ORF Transcript_64894/g.146384 Transcript_64894/m.146384 type:complete len:211 (+) Transcript_64894:401-1033(+)
MPRTPDRLCAMALVLAAKLAISSRSSSSTSRATTSPGRALTLAPLGPSSLTAIHPLGITSHTTPWPPDAVSTRRPRSEWDQFFESDALFRPPAAGRLAAEVPRLPALWAALWVGPRPCLSRPWLTGRSGALATGSVLGTVGTKRLAAATRVQGRLRLARTLGTLGTLDDEGRRRVGWALAARACRRETPSKSLDMSLEGASWAPPSRSWA